MEARPLISVIVPVYNAERYVERCFQSIADQTYDNLDVVVVDDGSVDSSAELCDAWARKDSRFQVVHQSNQGVACARNQGLDLAKGEYVAWVDSDDWIEPDYLQVLSDALYGEHADMSIEFGTADTSVVCGTDIVRRHLLGHFGYALWSTLARKGLYDGLRFEPSLIVGEDAYMLLQLRTKCRKVVLMGNTGYHYLMREDSLMHDVSENSLLAGVESRDAVCRYVRRTNAALEKYTHYEVLAGAAMSLRKIKASPSLRNDQKLKRLLKRKIMQSVWRMPYGALTRHQLKEVLSALSHMAD